MDNGKLSQVESKMLSKYMRDKLNFSVIDQLEFWRMSPTEVVDELKTKFGISDFGVPEVLRAIKATVAS